MHGRNQCTGVYDASLVVFLRFEAGCDASPPSRSTSDAFRAFSLFLAFVSAVFRAVSFDLAITSVRACFPNSTNVAVLLGHTGFGAHKLRGRTLRKRYALWKDAVLIMKRSSDVWTHVDAARSDSSRSCRTCCTPDAEHLHAKQSC